MALSRESLAKIAAIMKVQEDSLSQAERMRLEQQRLENLPYLKIESDPIFLASPASNLQYDDLAYLRSLPSALATIQKKEGPRGPEGKSIVGPIGPRGPEGKPGRPGIDGKDGVANIEEVKSLVDTSIQNIPESPLLHDSKMLGDYELDQSTLQEGDYLQVKGKKLVGVKPPKMDYRPIQTWVTSQGVSNIRHSTVTSSQSLEPFIRWIVDATAGDITLTIPSAQGRDAQWFEIMRIDGTANTVTILPTGSETFSDMSSYILQQWTNFQIFGYNNNYLIRQAT